MVYYTCEVKKKDRQVEKVYKTQKGRKNGKGLNSISSLCNNIRSRRRGCDEARGVDRKPRPLPHKGAG